MNTIVERIAADQRAALKAGDRLRLSTLRLLASELTNRRIELGRDLSDDEALVVLTRARKQRQESEEQFRSGGRAELADQEVAEAAVIDEYLPAPLSEAELDLLVDAALAETGATSRRDMGKVMAWLMPQVRGRVDGAFVSRKVQARLG